MKKFARWLVGAHFPVMGDGGKDTVWYLWCILIALLSMTLFGVMGWNGKEIEVLCMVLYLGASILPPIIAGVIALAKGEKWNPWYWFPTIIGFVVGGIIAIVVGLVGGWCMLF